MYRLAKYMPSFCSTGYQFEYFKFDSPSDYKDAPFLNEWLKDEEFLRFSLSGKSLMVEMTDGSFWVVGNFNTIKGLDIPKINFSQCEKRALRYNRVANA